MIGPPADRSESEPSRDFIFGFLEGLSPARLAHDIVLPFDLGNGSSLALVPEWLKTRREWARSEIVQFLLHDPELLCLCVDRNVVRDVKPSLLTEPPHTYSEWITQQELKFTSLALWLARVMPVGIGEVMALEESSGGVPASYTGPFRPERAILTVKGSAVAETVTREQLARARVFNIALGNVRLETSVDTAVTTVFRALTERVWGVRYLLLWIGLEALFSTSEAQSEITFRITNRIGFFLASGREEGPEIAKWAKTSYEHRSKIVHGRHFRAPGKGKRRSRAPGEAGNLTVSLEEKVRAALGKVLAEEEMLATFSDEAKRDRYLDGLMFGY